MKPKKTREEILADEDVGTTHYMMSNILLELQICKELIDDVMDRSGWDAAFFDVDIDLSVRFGEEKVAVREKWAALTV